MKKYAMPVMMLAVFEAVAITLWLTKGNLFYLFNFSYIGMSISLGVFLFIKKYRHGVREELPEKRFMTALSLRSIKERSNPCGKDDH